jgi:DNA-binding SARP family transcriptional activator
LPRFPKGVTVVLDALRLEDCLPALKLMARAVADAEGSRLIITVREIPEDGYGLLSGFHFVEPDELRFDAEEVGKLIFMMGGGADRAEVAEAVQEASMGQAALVCVLSKHLVSRHSTGAWHIPANADMTSLLIGLVDGQFTAPEMEVLYILGLLGSATITDIRSLLPAIDTDVFVRLADRIPLLRLQEGRLAVSSVIRMHTVAQRVFTSSRFTGRLVSDEQCLFDGAISILEHRREYDRVLSCLISHRVSESDLAAWLEKNGQRAVEEGARLAVREAIDSLPATSLLQHPSLLVLSAHLDVHLGLSEQSLAKAYAARDLARAQNANDLEMSANMLIAKALIDQCRLQEALDHLESAAASSRDNASADNRVSILSCLHAHAGLQLDAERARAAQREIEGLLDGGGLSQDAEATARIRVSGVALMFGDMQRSLGGYAEVLDVDGLPVELRASALANRGTLFMEVGKLDRAEESSKRGLEFASEYNLDSHCAACECALAGIEYAATATDTCLGKIEEVLEGFVSQGDRASEDFTRLYLAVMYRACRQVAASMMHVDRILEHSLSKGTEYFRLMAEIELCADNLALGDIEAARKRAGSTRDVAAERDAMTHLMRADMILAEIARREGRIEEARNRLLDHEGYILSENANWSIAMYIRAFPDLLGLFTSALGAERLPIHMLRMVTGHHIDDSLSAARKLLTEGEWQELAYRMLGEEGADRIAALAATPPCKVRLFGGLEVSVGTRQVTERDWYKRKARLLFAMLVLQQGREIPRDQVYDHLWPDMDEPRARNNFYVAWSAMRGALIPKAQKGDACPYIQHAGGVCKAVPEHIESDVAEFELLLSSARQSERLGDQSAAIRDYERIADLYRGELLPGDVYDDWFASARNHYRQEFCDAMRSGHHLLAEMGDHPGALRMIRRAIAADPWREDLYQAALRSHIASGQRSAAIDAYLRCRTNLAEQLGLDPSTETVHLYEQVLVMEEHSGLDAVR